MKQYTYNLNNLEEVSCLISLFSGELIAWNVYFSINSIGLRFGFKTNLELSEVEEYIKSIDYPVENLNQDY